MYRRCEPWGAKVLRSANSVPRENASAESRLQVARENVTARIYPRMKFVLPLRTHGALLNRYYEGLERMLLGK